MHPTIVAAVFPLIFVGELPDKTMFASLVMASRARPIAVWFGASAAFFVHVVIATTIGVGLFKLLPHRAVEVFVALLFALGAFFVFREANADETELIQKEEASHRRVVTTAFFVIFVAEWGDLTQVLTANLAAHYHSAVSVGVGATLALWSVAALAVTGGRGLLRSLPVALVRRITGVVLLILAAVALLAAFA
jgi:Ca2+/H+ antiporter, TMEM165/GDT1 family